MIRRVKIFCYEKGVTIYTPDLGKIYAEDVISKKTGRFSKNRYHSQGRFIRLLDTYYNTGGFDFATFKRGKVQPDNDEHKNIYHEYGVHLRSIYENENTVHFYEYELYYFLQYLNEIHVYDFESLTPAAVLSYIKSVKQCRQRAVLCGLRRYFIYSNRKGLYTAIEGIHAYRHKRIVPTRCGARCGEARNLKCENVYLDRGYVDILQSKSHKERRLFLSDELVIYLKKYNTAIDKCFPNREYFFLGAYRSMISSTSVSAMGGS